MSQAALAQEGAEPADSSGAKAHSLPPPPPSATPSEPPKKDKKAEKKAGGISKKQKQVGGAVLHSPFKLYSHI
jgi:hypothetical protein